jgi:hypothetical protein
MSSYSSPTFRHHSDPTHPSIPSRCHTRPTTSDITMSSPTTANRFTPTRPAPLPPSYSALSTPFSSYIPHQHIQPRPYSYSTTSLDSASTLSPEQHSTPTTRHVARSPLNTPLTISRPAQQGVHGRSISYPTISPSSSGSRSHGSRSPSSSPAYSRLPTELSLFDHRPRQTLLADIECIIGKKLHFPILSPSKRKEKKAKVEAKKGEKLKKERRISEDDLFWNGMGEKREEVVVIEKKKGRGVREGNWI